MTQKLRTLFEKSAVGADSDDVKYTGSQCCYMMSWHVPIVDASHVAKAACLHPNGKENELSTYALLRVYFHPVNVHSLCYPVVYQNSDDCRASELYRAIQSHTMSDTLSECSITNKWLLLTSTRHHIAVLHLLYHAHIVGVLVGLLSSRKAVRKHNSIFLAHLPVQVIIRRFSDL